MRAVRDSCAKQGPRETAGSIGIPFGQRMPAGARKLRLRGSDGLGPFRDRTPGDSARRWRHR
jgi:hypothetical protein